MGIYLADEVSDLIGGVIGFFLVAIVPIIYMLLSHQRKMTQLLQGKTDEAQHARIQLLENEVATLKDRVNTLVLHTEDRRSLQERVSPPNIPEDALRH